MTDREKRQTDREREKQRKPETDTQKKKNQREAEKRETRCPGGRDREMGTERRGKKC